MPVPQPRLVAEPSSGFRKLAVMADRTLRITMDALLVIAFSPVILAWWLTERRARWKQ